MATWWCTNNPEHWAEVNTFEPLMNGKITIELVIKELDKYVKGYLSSKKSHEKWVNFKPFENPKDFPQRLANSIHKVEIEAETKIPENTHTYVKDMMTQKTQFTVTMNALVKYLNTLNNEKIVNKTMKKLETRINKIK